VRAHFLQHVPFEGLGSIEFWLQRAGYEVTATRFYDTDELPPPAEVDLVVAMGGPMSVNDEHEHPWLAAEKRFIRAVVEQGLPVLGVCLGAQLIASACGAAVYPNKVKEIGWLPIQGVAPDTGDNGDDGDGDAGAEQPATFRFPPFLEVFHWHGDTFDLPEGAVRLARSNGALNQAFQLGRSVIGLQFHLDTTADSARKLVENCRAELVPSMYVQSEKGILAAAPAKYRALNGWMDQVLAFITGVEPR
jgi:GMP synthase-like glutamine amidotransferase